MDVADLLDSLLLLDALAKFDDIRVESVVLGGGLQVVNVGEEPLVVSESNTLKRLNSTATHLCEDPSDEVDCAEHLLHSHLNFFHDPIDI